MADDPRYSGPYGAIQWGWDRLVGSDGHIDPAVPRYEPGYYVSYRGGRPPFTTHGSYFVEPKWRVVGLFGLAASLYVAPRGQPPRFVEHPVFPGRRGLALDVVERGVTGQLGGADRDVLALAQRGLLDTGERSGVVVFVIPVWQADPAPAH